MMTNRLLLPRSRFRSLHIMIPNKLELQAPGLAAICKLVRLRLLSLLYSKFHASLNMYVKNIKISNLFLAGRLLITAHSNMKMS